MGVEVIGKTLMLSRWEDRMIEADEHKKTYTQEYCKAVLRGTGEGENRITSSYVVTQSDLDGLNILIRFETDAVLPSSILSTSVRQTKPGDADELASLLDCVKLDGQDQTDTSVDDLPYEIVETGTLPVFEDLIEVKTRISRSPYRKTDIRTQAVWGALTVMVGRHRGGDFSVKPNAPIQDLHFDDLQGEHAITIGRSMTQVAALLTGIRRLVLDTVGEGKQVAILCSSRPGVRGGRKALRIHHYKDEDAQPKIREDMREKFRSAQAA